MGYLDKATAADFALVQNQELRDVLFLPVVQAFAHKAALQFFGSGINIDSASSFRNVFEEKEGDSDFGVIPLENSLTSSIHENYLLLEYDVRIVRMSAYRPCPHWPS